MDSGQLHRSMRLSIAEGGLATAMGVLISGLFLTGFALAMGASRLQIGILAALQSLGSIAQLLGSYFIERTGRRKAFCLVVTTASRLMWVLVVLVPVLVPGAPSETKVWYIIGLVAVSSMLSSMGGVAWLSWIKVLVPNRCRVDFLGRRQLVTTALGFIIGLVGGVLIDVWKGYSADSLTGFLVVFGLAMVCGLAGLPILAAIPEPETPRAPRQPFFRLLAAPLQEANFRRVMLFYVLWNMSCNVAGPFFTVYMLQKMELPFGYVTLLGMLSCIAGMVSNGFWTRLGQKFGMKPVVFLATLGDAFYPFWWLLIGPEGAWVLGLVHLSGVFGSALSLGPNNLVLKIAPDRNASPYMAVFNATVGPASFLAAVLGGWLAGALGNVEWALGPLTLGGLKVVFLISFLGRLGSLFLLRGIVEPESESVERLVHVLGRTRRFRRLRGLYPALARRLRPVRPARVRPSRRITALSDGQSARPAAIAVQAEPPSETPAPLPSV